MTLSTEIRPCLSPLDREQAFDIRRSVLCGELHLNREAARDEDDESAYLAIAWLGEKPVGTGRLLQRGPFWQMEHLCVLPEQRKQGVGRGLVEHFIGKARSQGSQELVVVSPVAAQAFFSGLGFELAASQADLSVLKRPIG
jgi:N-acetylglutamate synthase-like GNAT family acetyltransferase